MPYSEPYRWFVEGSVYHSFDGLGNPLTCGYYVERSSWPWYTGFRTQLCFYSDAFPPIQWIPTAKANIFRVKDMSSDGDRTFKEYLLMTAFAAISLDDHTTAPVVFNPSVIDSQGVAKLFETAGTLDERRSISLSVKLPKVGGSVARVMTKVVIPVMDSSTPPIKIGEAIFSGEFVLPKVASLNARKDLRAFAAELLADGSVEAAVEGFESIY